MPWFRKHFADRISQAKRTNNPHWESRREPKLIADTEQPARGSILLQFIKRTHKKNAYV
jgi:hypothetical protein